MRVHSRSVTVAACIAVLLLSGCVDPGGRHHEARALSMRERILLPETGSRHGSEASGTPRRGAIPDRPLTLEDAVAIALAGNHSIKVSAEDVRIAAADVEVARSLFFPQVTGTYGFVHNEMQPAFVNPDVPSSPPFLAGERSFRRAELGVQMILWDFGKTLGTYRQAVLAKEIADSWSRRNVQQVRWQVAEAYWTVLRSRRARLIAQESLAQAEAHLEVARSFQAQEMVDRSDVLRAEIRIADVRQELIRSINAVEVATAVFNGVLGIDVHHETDLVDKGEIPAVVVSHREALVLAVDNRIEIKAIERSIRLEEQGLIVARAGHLPKIYVAGGYDWSSDAYRQWSNRRGDLRDGAWLGEIGIQINLFDGGRTQARTRVARSRIRRAEEQARQLCDGIAIQVRMAVFGFTEAVERTAVGRKAVAQAKENLRLVGHKYRQNVASSTDVVDAETALSRAQGNYYGAVYDCHIALARLVFAIGTESPLVERPYVREEAEHSEERK